jgi:hypothetical protein
MIGGMTLERATDLENAERRVDEHIDDRRDFVIRAGFQDVVDVAVEFRFGPAAHG